MNVSVPIALSEWSSVTPARDARLQGLSFNATPRARALVEQLRQRKRLQVVELHDGIAQVLTGQSLLLGAVQPSVTDADAADLLAGAVDAAAEAQRHVRALIQDLSPIELEARNLHDLVQRSAAAFSARYPFRIELGELPSNELPAYQAIIPEPEYFAHAAPDQAGGQ